MIEIGIKSSFDYQRDFLDKICSSDENNDTVRIM